MFQKSEKTALQIWQEVYDYLSRSEKKAGYTRGPGDFVCQYRDDLGRHCAIGSLLPDGPDMPWQFASGVRSLLHVHPRLSVYLLPSDMDTDAGLDFLRDIQRVHDCYWERRLEAMNDIKMSRRFGAFLSG